MTSGEHENKNDRDGHKNEYDHSRTKDVRESGGGKHDKDDKGKK
ncbi:MAG TPA: hypothetical protein VGL88_11710 [Pseudonocardiaceae bacterium]|jgi:hypothetical protein